MITIENVVELTTDKQWKEAFPVMKQLRTDLVLETYLKLLDEMKKDGYRLFALYAGNQIVALTGISLRGNFYSKHHVFIYDLVTDIDHRSQGYGEKLLTIFIFGRKKMEQIMWHWSPAFNG